MNKTPTYYRKKCVTKAKRLAVERDGAVCQHCGVTKASGRQIHGSHVFPEGRYHGMSADVDNIKALCYQCHFNWWHKHPIEASEWFKKKFPDRYKVLKKRSLLTLKIDWKKRWEIMKTL